MTHKGWLIGSAVMAIGVFVLMLVGVTAGWVWVADMDAGALDPLHRIGEANPGWVRGWDIFCTVFGPTVFRLVTVVVIVIAFVRRNVHVGMFLVISVELSGLVTQIAKDLVDRPRPATALVHAGASSFPSGHALGVMVAVAALLTVALPLVRPAWRGALVVLGVVLVIAIGAGRVVLNVHHPSDVIAGWALGYAYFVACLLLVPPRRAITQPDEIPAEPGTAR
ncbi:membrane-associated phospholipid phosphatase [Mycolicibacterium chubuense NBB4]|uniref:Membrane-associated phospholipid phosphatase n=1 Tax=Mycolicibacterium chubuense (strain NBB4) TaxID=710421 RepID=I4BD02_MYCCN|nr:phosphatase PAP2 family protein [Mycolicibacterium chubuense]AFM15159.1 membrane-associated phospholipid phosphatase [Mycolicibacterium chubuense NBB4]